MASPRGFEVQDQDQEHVYKQTQEEPELRRLGLEPASGQQTERDLRHSK
jgi:hypothetical protein